MAAGFFRKSALEKLSTPEKLDQLIKITSPRAWLSLIAIGLVLATAIIWGMKGNIKTKIASAGILLGGEIYDILSTSRGQLLELPVKLGDIVKEGDVVAVIAQTLLLQQIEEAKASLEERKYDLQQIKTFGSQDTRIQKDFINQQRLSLKKQIESTEKNKGFLKQQLETEKELLEKGLITRPQVVNTEQQLEGAQNQIENLKGQFVQTSSQELNVAYDQTQRITLINQRIAQEERRLEQLYERFEEQSKIQSPHNGRVVEILTDVGAIVGPGTQLFKVSDENTSTGELRGVLYVPSRDGKKIKVGMEVLVVPATVQPQEFGFMKAKVTYVSEFSATQKGMMTILKNDQLVRQMMSLGAPFEIYVDFEKNPDSYSGFAWTSANGPPIEVNPGTSCSGQVTVLEQAPITLVVPALKKFFEIY